MAAIDEVKQQIASQDAQDVKRLDNNSRTTIKNSFDTYVSATTSISKYCVSATSLFNELIRDRDDGPTQNQKKLLIKTLNDGIKITWDSREAIRNTFPAFNDVIGFINLPLSRIAGNEHLKNKVRNLFADIVNLKSQYEFEVRLGGSLEVQLQETSVFVTIINTYPEIYDKVLQSVERLLARCDDYRQRHE